MLANKILNSVVGSTEKLYVDDVFSTYLYTGNGSTQTINNGIDLAGKGGLVWVKARTGLDGQIFASHFLADTLRGAGKQLVTNSTGAQFTDNNFVSSFSGDGFSLGTALSSPNTYASWTFRKQPKFFDVVTYTGNATANRAIPHSLGSTPGCIILKNYTEAGFPWVVYHQNLGNTKSMYLNTSDPAGTSTANWSSTSPTSTTFTVGNSNETNRDGQAYVAYLFAHDAGGFGLTGTDNVISCGSYTGTGANGLEVNLGYEPQWLLVKRATGGATPWGIFDLMRTGQIQANTSSAEVAVGYYFNYGTPDGLLEYAPSATGFKVDDIGPAWNNSGDTYIYIAIRRGPMKTPTSGTKVFRMAGAIANYGSFDNTPDITGFDLAFIKGSQSVNSWQFVDRLRGLGAATDATITTASKSLSSDSTASETNGTLAMQLPGTAGLALPTATFLRYAYVLKRAPGFFDVVCYTGNGGSLTVNHNLAAIPELVIVKPRTTDPNFNGWSVSAKDDTQGSNRYSILYLNTTAARDGSNSPGYTSSQVNVMHITGGWGGINNSGINYVMYLFASCPGVSKVGSYTGNGSSQTINCGFTGGARFVLIKRTDSTGDWYVWDSARGIVSANDPHLSLNTTADEVTTDDSVDPDNSGFIVNQVAATNINVTSATYIYLAIA